jgi:hypothetical protein
VPEVAVDHDAVFNLNWVGSEGGAVEHCDVGLWLGAILEPLRQVTT